MEVRNLDITKMSNPAFQLMAAVLDRNQEKDLKVKDQKVKEVDQVMKATKPAILNGLNRGPKRGPKHTN